MNESPRIFIACTESEWLPAEVLKYSIEKHSSRPVVVELIYKKIDRLPIPVKPRNRPRTPFSFQRFVIPSLCDYKGRAIYLDADMMVFQDIADVYDMDMGGADVLAVKEGDSQRRGQFSVMLIDCVKCQWSVESIVRQLDNGDFGYEDLMYDLCIAEKVGRIIHQRWNSLEYYQRGETALLHFTDMNTQPWTTRKNPLEQLWIDVLLAAIKGHHIQLEDVKREITLGHIRPSLLAQLLAELNGTDLPSDIDSLDKKFVPPFKLISGSKYRPIDILKRVFLKVERQVRGG
ncbi:glycosyltransferase [Hahella ganghwensis]|uniref:glycosyltransferase n=1 Tax=Hahella ganghwensis TaxID=286420 RepID=UPI000369929B|nr:glycosyltransferase [Hahella ganghwensis]